MKIYRCKELLRLPRLGSDGQHVEGEFLSVTTSMVFTTEDDTENVVRLEGLRGMRLSLSRQTLRKYFEELA